MPRIVSPDYEAALFKRAHEGGMWHRWDTPPARPTKTSTVTLDVFVNDARWIITCPCGGAQLAQEGQTQFFCVDCLNETQGGAWVKVKWPNNQPAIDAALKDRPLRNQHWTPGETVAHLLAENKANAVKTRR